MTAIDVDEARQAIGDLPAGTSHGETPAPEHVYLPRSHVRAMDPDTLLVTGMRGAGKTFWWSALQEDAVRQLLGAQRSALGENTEVRTGFGVRPLLDEYPNKDVLHTLVDRGFEPRTIWRTVHAWQLAPKDHPIKQHDSWPARTRYVAAHAEATEHLFQNRDAELERKGVYLLIFREEYQREKFHAIAGRWMGTDRRRGFPYTWIPNHLADTDGRVSPRSFLAALKTAAAETTDRHSEHQHALHYDSIKRGVQAASKIRVSELQEDYPWVHRVLSPLRGMVVPCEFGEIAQRWKSRGVLDRLAEETEQNEVKLPPRHIDRGAEGVREDLETLRVFMHMRDGRVNIPDVFRVGYGLGRRGGVKPVE